MIKCKDCRFGGLKVLLDNESAPCLRLDDEECPNYNEETGEIEMRNTERKGRINEVSIPFFIKSSFRMVFRSTSFIQRFVAPGYSTTTHLFTR